ncbi:MAG: enoyl-CoA hydratase/isomerase family protein [Halieaceae bacterium]|jgi:enoyl-CoA hydratase/carnithine racemase|nr:enoyl-CoA hydratase/isomerase family protein [Halieaceae bacterium]
MSNTIEYSLSDSIGTLRLCREDRHNALGAAELDAIDDILDAIALDAELRALVITNTGDRTFCAGAALDDLNSGKITPDRFQGVMERLAKLPLPTIARVNGSVFGGGVELALSCDFRIGVNGTRLRVPAASFGLCYPPAGIARFVNKLGANAARRMLIAAETLEAAELHRLGFFDYLVDSDELDDRVDELSVHLAGLAPLAVAAIKELVQQAEHGSIDPVRGAELVERCAQSADLQEGFAAQREKRSPQFVGR